MWKYLKNGKCFTTYERQEAIACMDKPEVDLMEYAVFLPYTQLLLWDFRLLFLESIDCRGVYRGMMNVKNLSHTIDFLASKVVGTAYSFQHARDGYRLKVYIQKSVFVVNDSSVLLLSQALRRIK